ncbi:MAG: tRNA (adenosine(37)-N6)-threonylcarbamoyltransferase complex dimerization subunit type 1 TsaB [Magnetococcales bacterium]|nr:tRNA (adenosine(37)-N6)-threonylcarbamoyltransferase complex dimerization subunit type 1 TsaB [Magnetococcales bacterium]NGZ27779.1 tRNA (adenosine(37)-N6)-threonylcarbamoyltransferase complex dimerization subunit type 1 TsaB [Magnetococcales bacterium]
MKILAMDTAIAPGSVALVENGVIMDQRLLPVTPGQVATLPMALEEMMRANGERWSDIQLTVVTQGPGSFTGVRIALGMGKGLSIAHGIPLVGVPTLELLAAGARQLVGEGAYLLPVLDARRQEMFTAIYQIQQGWPVVVGDTFCLSLEHSLARLLPNGEGYVVALPAMLEQLCLPVGWRGLPVDFSIQLLALAGERLYQQQGGAGPLLEPLYVRPSEAESKRGP